MVRLNTLTFQWILGVFCAALGTLMLIAPHQFASSFATGMNPWLPYWGGALFVAGSGLLVVAALVVHHMTVTLALLYAAVVVGALAISFVVANGFIGVGVYGTLVIALLVAAILPKTTAPQPDLLATTIALNHVQTAILLVATPAQSPLVTVFQFPTVWLGLAFAMAGTVLLLAQYLRLRPVFNWLVHSMAALPMVLFLLLIGIPTHIWPGILYHGYFGLIIILLPWLGKFLHNVVVGSLRIRLALAFTGLTVLPLVVAITLITSRDEQQAVAEVLRQQNLLATATATSIDAAAVPADSLALTSERILATQPIESATHIYLIDATGRVLAQAAAPEPAAFQELVLPSPMLSQRLSAANQSSVADTGWLISTAPLVSHTWRVVVARPTAVALESVYASREYAFMLLGIVAIVAAGLGVLTAHWLTRPLAMLTTAARDLDNAQFAQQLLPTNIAEIDQLATSFDDLRERLNARTVERDSADQQRIQLLEQERTARLTAEHIADQAARLQFVTAALAQSLTSAQIAQVIANQAVAALGAVAGLVAICSPDRTMLEIVSLAGYPLAAARDWERFPTSAKVPLSVVFCTGRSVFIESLAERDEQFPALRAIPSVDDSVAAIVLPLMINHTPIGILGFSLAAYRPIDAAERSFMETLAGLCAQALERARLFEAEQAARAEAEAAVRVRETFLSIASHELKTPLTLLQGHAELLERRSRNASDADERSRRSATVILEQTQRLNRLVTTLLDVTRVGNGKLSLDLQIVDMCLLVQHAVTEQTLLLDDHSLQFTPPAELLLTMGDPLRLEQVVLNLLSNAIKYSPSGSIVAITLMRNDHQALLNIRDCGIGIPENALPHLFTPFYRAENAQESGISGIGIGLHVVSEIVTLHGGEIQVTSQQGHGSSFTVALPLYLQPPPQV